MRIFIISVCITAIALLAYIVYKIYFAGIDRGVMERYQRCDAVTWRMTGSPDYENYVVGDAVFVGATLLATNGTTVSGKPPFKSFISVRSLDNSEVAIEILEVKYSIIDTSTVLVDIAASFDSLEQTHVPTVVASEKSHYFQSDYIVHASPLKGEKVELRVKVMVSDSESFVEKELVFEFCPIAKRVVTKGLPF